MKFREEREYTTEILKSPHFKEEIIYKQLLQRTIKGMNLEQLKHFFKIEKIDPFSDDIIEKYKLGQLTRSEMRTVDRLKMRRSIVFSIENKECD